MTRRQSVLVGYGTLVAFLTGMLHFHAVGNDLSSDDRKFIPYYLAGIRPLPIEPDYDQELAYISAVQQAVLRIAPGNDGLPEGQLREPMQLYLAGTGQCFDRSRVIEKILNYAGFQTRHVFILALAPNLSPLKALFTPHITSHAVTEVLTRKNWLVVDSNTDWLALRADRTPVSIETLRMAMQGRADMQWYLAPPAAIYTRPFTYLYGLHSRHGGFYPPYNRIPDIQYSEFIDNVF